ncbi:hypothetical protein ACRTAL_002297 [Clostridium perfringens]
MCKCKICNNKVDELYGETCAVCESSFCKDHEYKNGARFWLEDEEASYYYICKDCLEKGLEYINANNIDKITFNQLQYDEAMDELECALEE